MAETLGFLSVLRHPEHGYFGGFLVVNSRARPLEFHCTVPVKPSRAQVLLYGPTIDDFVCGEQIAKALTSKAKLKPQLNFTDCPGVLAVQQVSAVPVVLVREAGQTTSTVSGNRDDTKNNAAANALTVPGTNLKLRTLNHHMADRSLQLSAADLSDGTTFDSKVLDCLDDDFDLIEPFQRIVEALQEAHPITKAA